MNINELINVLEEWKEKAGSDVEVKNNGFPIDKEGIELITNYNDKKVLNII